MYANYILACTRARARADKHTQTNTYNDERTHHTHMSHEAPDIVRTRACAGTHACSDACTYTHTRACVRHTYQRTQTCCTLASASALIRASSAAFCRASSSALGCACACAYQIACMPHVCLLASDFDVVHVVYPQCLNTVPHIEHSCMYARARAHTHTLVNTHTTMNTHIACAHVPCDAYTRMRTRTP